MTISQWTGVAGRQAVQIVTVDPRTRRIEGRLRDGAVIQVALPATSVLFRWPNEGEWWFVEYKTGGPVLCDYVEQPDAAQPIEELMPGEARIDSSKVVVPGDVVVTGAINPEGGLFRADQVPLESIDGVRTTFTVSESFVPETLSVTLNGLQEPVAEMLPNRFGFADAPILGDLILCAYQVGN